MPEETMREAVKELHAAVLALRELIEREYPRREEVERRFASRKLARRRWISMLIVVPLMLMASFLTTITTVSYCFIDEAALRHKGCHVIPGFEEAVKRNEVMLKRFTQLIDITEENSRRLDKLEAKVKGLQQ